VVGIGGVCSPRRRSKTVRARARAGLADVPILRENQTIAAPASTATCSCARCFPPRQPRGDRRIAGAAAWSINAPSRQVMVARNTGSVVVLESSALHAITGRFRYTGGAAGDVVTIGNDAASVLGSEGLFYLENVSAGPQPVRIDTGSGTVQCTLDVPTDAKPGIIDLGEVACGGTQ
jgi:hypothetical protein